MMPKPALPHIAWLATGGTLAGAVQAHADNAHPGNAQPALAYTAAQFSPQALLGSLPILNTLATWHCVQPYCLASQNLGPEHMLALRAALLAQLHNPQVDAVLVTHGTDTLEDMLYFLHLTLPPASLCKPVLFTAAMLPWDAEGSDGPANLEAAALCLNQLCLNPGSAGAGLLPAAPVPAPPLGLGVLMNGQYTPAPWVRKRKTLGVDAFSGAGFEGHVEGLSKPLAEEARQVALPDAGAFSTCFDECAAALDAKQGAGKPAGQWEQCWHTLEVPVLYCTPGPAVQKQLQALTTRVALGDPNIACVVVAAPGHGNVPECLLPDLQSLLAAGVNVVRASRVPEGGVHPGGEPQALETWWQETKPKGQVFLQGNLSLGQVVVRERLRAMAAAWP